MNDDYPWWHSSATLASDLPDTVCEAFAQQQTVLGANAILGLQDPLSWEGPPQHTRAATHSRVVLNEPTLVTLTAGHYHPKHKSAPSTGNVRSYKALLVRFPR